jgi:site-specific recombinase XerC
MRFSNRSAQRARKNHTVTPSTSLSGGIAPNRVFHATELLSFATGSFPNRKTLAPSTINVRLAAVRRLASEASDTGLLSTDTAAGVRRVKGAKRLGGRIGNWLTIDQSRALLGKPSDSLRGKRDRAIVALLIGCGLRRAELEGLRTGDFQVREDHCVIADLAGKGKHIRTVPVPLWAKRAVDERLGRLPSPVGRSSAE